MIYSFQETSEILNSVYAERPKDVVYMNPRQPQTLLYMNMFFQLRSQRHHINLQLSVLDAAREIYLLSLLYYTDRITEERGFCTSKACRIGVGLFIPEAVKHVTEGVPLIQMEPFLEVVILDNRGSGRNYLPST